MIRVLSLFSGIGAFEKALENLGIEHEVVNYCEIDPYAGKAYSLIHNIPQEKNLVDVTKVDTSKLENIDLVTYGFPCQDISIAGKQKGFEDEDGNTTRSGLFFEALRIIQDTKPKYAIAENVKNLMSKSFERELDIVLNSLGAAGYNNYCKVLNAKDYGIPQNRERVFIVSIRRDVDDFNFEFPEKEKLKINLKDLLEINPDDKYFLTSSQTSRMKINNKDSLVYDCSMIGHEHHAREYENIMPSITAREYKDPRIVNQSKLDKLRCEVVQLGNIWPSVSRNNPNVGRIYDDNGISPSLTTMQGGHRQPFIIASRGRYGEDGKIEQHYEPNLEGVSNTLTTVQKDNYVCDTSFRVRKLTPKECFRLMGFDDEDIDVLVENGISNTQIYKMAGNSIVVDVLERLFECLLLKKKEEPDLFSMMFEM